VEVGVPPLVELRDDGVAVLTVNRPERANSQTETMFREHTAAAVALRDSIRLAAPTAKLSCAFVRVGLSCGELGTSWQLTRLIGYGRAAELGYTGRVVDAAAAARIGLVNRVVPADALFAEADALALECSADSRAVKRALLRNAEGTSYAAALELEAR
jgi:enoyl-CoA hydratase/carnithine racemase